MNLPLGVESYFCVDRKRRKMETRWPTSPFSCLPALPPVTVDDRDRRFLEELNGWISDELSQVNAQDIQQYYGVYKQVFSKVSNVY